MSGRRITPALAGLAMAALLLAGCKSSDSTSPNSVDLSGTYSLQALTEPGSPTIGPPFATGTLVLTQTQYTLTLNVTGQNPIQDQGTYTVSGNNWTQTSSTPGVPQGVGTYSLSGNTLSVDVTTAGQTVSTVWQKQ